MKIKVAIYVRLSREDEDKIDNQKESRSITNQIATLKTVAQEYQFLVYKVYSDEGYSGGDFNRPALKALLNDMGRKKFQVLLLKDLSRLGRSLHKVGELIEDVFPSNGIRVISVNDRYDSSAYKDDLSIVFKSFLNDYYLREFKKKCRKARIHYAQTKHLNYYPKYGYRYDEKGKEIVDEYAANIVQSIYLDIGYNDFSCGAVADRLNVERVLTRSEYATSVLGLKALHRQTAKKWNAEMVWAIATDYEYCGHSINWGRHKKEEQILLKNTHCKIISEELFSRVQEQIKNRSKIKTKLVHLGKNIIDIQTGKNLLFSKKQQIYFLRCYNKKIYSIDKEELETVISSEIIHLIKNCLERQFAENRKKNKEALKILQYNYATLIESSFQARIDKISFTKSEKILLGQIREIEKQEQGGGVTRDLLQYRLLLAQWKKNQSVDYIVMNALLEKVEIIKYENNNITIRIKYKN